MLSFLENESEISERNVLNRMASNVFRLLFANEPDFSVDTFTKLKIDVGDKRGVLAETLGIAFDTVVGDKSECNNDENVGKVTADHSGDSVIC